MTNVLKPREEAVITNEPESFAQKGRWTTFYSLFDRQYRGEQVGAMNASLHATTRKQQMLATEALRAARMMERGMRSKGFEPIDKPESYWFFGPYPHRPSSVLLGQGKTVAGNAETDSYDLDVADFLLIGYFLAPRGHITSPEPFK